MARIETIEFSMDISKRVYQEWSDYALIETAQKIAVYTVIPMMMIAFVEAVIKNLIIINLLNVSIIVINETQDFFAKKQILPPLAPATAPIDQSIQNLDLPLPATKTTSLAPPPNNSWGILQTIKETAEGVLGTVTSPYFWV
jgi:hypothetical protein